MAGKAWSDLEFDNHFLRELPADPSTARGTRQVLGACHSRVQPTPVSAPRLLAHSREAVQLLGLSQDVAVEPRFTEVLSGNGLLHGMESYAACYGGHQFGHWAGQLGDGRAIGLGHAVGEGGRRWELQLKGAGPTPYSRSADGRAVLRSSIREFVCSEAMHHLGVPSTRALSLVSTGDEVMRDMFYDGRAAYEPGAVVCRMAPSFLRFGSFELPASRGELPTLKALLAYTLERHFPDCGPPGPEGYARMYGEICERTAELVIHFMRVGFVHGVLNTDNMSIHGLCIDYGPYGFLDGYDPRFTPNTTDAQGRRYSYGRQPEMAGWNLVRLGEALLSAMEGEEALLQDALDRYGARLTPGMRAMRLAKLGLSDYQPDIDEALLEEVEALMLRDEIDFTLFYRGLAEVGQGGAHGEASDRELFAPLADAYYAPPSEQALGDACRFLRRLLTRVEAEGVEPTERRARMHRQNPKFIFRNYLAQEAIDAAEAGDPTRIAELLELMRNPYDEQPEREELAAKRPEWARNRAGCSMLSCSS